MNFAETKNRKAPRWMHGGIHLLAGVADFKHLEELLNNNSNVMVNAPVALTACAVKSQMDLLELLVKQGLLTPTLMVRDQDMEAMLAEIRLHAQKQGAELYGQLLERVDYLEAPEVADVVVKCVSTGRTPEEATNILLRLARDRTVKAKARALNWFVVG